MEEPEIRFHSRRDASPYDLGHALAEVGPGWWPLLRQAYADVARTPGAMVMLVRQKVCFLDILVVGLGGNPQSKAFRQRYRRLSARVCEVCGGPAVPVTERIPRPTRTHCDVCAAQWRTEHDGDERRLWMEHAGRWLPEWGTR